MRRREISLKLILVVVGAATSLGALLLTARSLVVLSSDLVTRQIGETMSVLADQVHDKIDITLFERSRDLEDFALSLASLHPESIPFSERLSRHHEGFKWKGFITNDGRLITYGGGAPVPNAIVSKLPAIVRSGEDAHAKVTVLKPAVAEDGPAVILFSVPVRSGQGHVFAAMDWTWMERIQLGVWGSNLAHRHSEVAIAMADGAPLFGFLGSQTIDSTQLLRPGTGGWYLEADAASQVSYLTGYSRNKPRHAFPSAELTVLVRQRSDRALLPLSSFSKQIMLYLALFGVHVVLVHAAVGSALASPLKRIADFASALRVGSKKELPKNSAIAEVNSLSESLEALLQNLGAKEQSLRNLSSSLEIQVEDRTRALSEKNALLIAARQEAEVAVREKSRLLAVASHDLRQPMHALSLFTLALKRRLAGRDEISLLGRMEASLKSLVSMLDGLLHVARLDARLVDVHRDKIYVPELITRLGVEFGTVADRRGLRFDYTSAPCWVMADPVLLETAVRNLVSNAFKFTARGGIHLAARARGSRVLIEVYDTGLGVSSDRLGSIFDEFHRGVSDANGSNEGLGLGLSIVKRNAALIDAQVDVRSDLGRGSRFSLSMVREAHAEVVDVVAPPPNQQVTDLNDLSVLLLEDNALALEALSLDLRDRGAFVKGFLAPELADAALQCGLQVDVAIIDYDLSDGPNGLEVMKRWRALRKQFAIILLTGRTDQPTLDDIKQSGAQWVSKPADADLLAALIASFSRSKSPKSAGSHVS